MNYFPQTFFSGSVNSFPRLVLCFILTVSVLALLYIFISKNYFLLIKNISTLDKKSSKPRFSFNFSFLRNVINKYLLSDNYERAAYDLTKNQIHNSRFLKTKYFPLAVMPLLVLLIGYFSDLPNLLFFSGAGSGKLTEPSFFKTVISVMSPSLSFTLLMSSRLLISNTKILDENSTGTLWIYESLPLKNMSSVIKGADKYVYINFILPVLIIIFVLLNFKADPQTVLLNILFVASGMYFINSVGLLFDKTYPFTLESTKLNSASKFIEVIVAMVFAVLLFLLQLFVFQNIIFVITAVIIFILLSYLINRN